MKATIKLFGIMFLSIIVLAALATSCKPKQQSATVTATPLTDFEIDGTTLVKYIGNDTSVVIPHGITEIGVMAFSGKGLTSVVIPDSVTEIVWRAFIGNQLTSVIIPNSVTLIAPFAFADNQLTGVTIPDSVTEIVDNAFIGNQLTSVTLSRNTIIGDLAFDQGVQIIYRDESQTATQSNLLIPSENQIKVWGWSNDGKTGISMTYDPNNGEGRGDIITRAFILDTVTDGVLWESEINSFDYVDESTWERNDTEYGNAYSALTNNLQQSCRQYSIAIQDISLNKDTAARYSGNQINFNINIIPEDTNDSPDLIKSYTVTASTNDGRSKTLFTKNEVRSSSAVIDGICTSPDNERALIIIKESSYWSIHYEFTGCILSTGFR